MSSTVQVASTVQVHLPNTLSLACPDCGQSARAFAYQQATLRDLVPIGLGADSILQYGGPVERERVVASVRTWRWTCECGLMVQVENRVDIGTDGEPGPVVETTTVNDPLATTSLFGSTDEILLGLNDDLSLTGTFLDRHGEH
jgi:hypothetical protein